jgi:SNF2 family DNA or RNA helicase
MRHIDRRLLDFYYKLPTFHKNVVQLCALAHEPINYQILFKCLQRLNTKPAAGRFAAKEILFYLDDLVKDGFLYRDDVHYGISASIENEVVKDLFKTIDFSYFADTLSSFMPIYLFSSWHEIPLKRYYRSIRIALLKGDFDKIEQISKVASFQHEDAFNPTSMFGIITETHDEDWLSSLPNEVIYYGALDVLGKLLNDFEVNVPFFSFLEKEKQEINDHTGREFRNILQWKYILEGNFDKATVINEKEDKDSQYYSFNILNNFFIGENEAAIDALELAVKFYKKESKQRKLPINHKSAQFGYLALLKKDVIENTAEIVDFLASNKEYLPLNNTLAAIIYAQKNQMNLVQEVFRDADDDGIGNVFLNYAKYWVYREQGSFDIETLELLYENAQKHGLKLPAFLISEILEKAYLGESESEKSAIYTAIKEEISETLGAISLINMIPLVEPWERAIIALSDLSSQFEQGTASLQKDKRLIWLISFNSKTVEVKEQKIGKNGKWTKGRTISSERLMAIARTEDFLTAQDTQVIASLDESSNWYNNAQFDFNDNLIKALVSHPNLYLNNEHRTAVEIISEEPQLVVQKIGGDFELSFNVPVKEEGVRLVKETPTRYKAIEVTQQHLLIANAIGSEKVRLPATAEDKIADVVKGFSKVVNVQSEILAMDENIQTVEGNSTPHIHLLPMGEGFQLEMYVKPFGEHPPYYKPSEGGQVILTEIEGERVQAERQLEEEKKLAREIIKNCPSLEDTRKLDKIWEFDSPESCLEILTELEPLKIEGKVVIEWPKGERLKLKGVASFDQLAMSIKGSTDWFEASGTLKVGEDLVMDMKELLGLLGKTDSRFIKLKNGDFLALTNRFRQQLKALEAYADTTKEGLRFHPLAAFAVEELTSEAKDLETDAAWKAQLQKLKDAEKIKIELPSTFKAELRTYQHEGYNWLMKLANWDVGACLADDMGLGKTVQALAAILTRAKDGPTLIVCPSSVRINWEREAMKFAPTMKSIQFGGPERQQILDTLKPFDMLITSYGLLQSEEDNFSKVQFSTIVLDEAQAIKNRSAKRSKAAMELNGNFKVITTGTPIENHLGELWNLFRFINPGLLGSLNRFRDRFALPIEKYADDERREQLKKLIRPFILRRRKSEVLLELPEKTEVVLTVELSPSEKAFYEALRISALEKLQDVQPGDGQNHLQILAEITRLRQACCNPKLVTKTSLVKSSKMELFNTTVEELLENGHKVLVFSQFVKHLRLLEESLQARNINYQYLDGSTPQKKRQEAIDAFQGGDGDVFLISLKAGGVGLNLTAADYVIHMDPWWNPAVEDQASDRAHRIGQKRPVTIYRLVAAGTIEEKIVKLHDQKRDLADSLLSGTNNGNKMTANDLMDLIKEGMR